MSDPPARLSAALGDRYVLERELGRGGMAIVYLAEDVRLHRQVAIKVLHPELGAVLGADRFLREIGLVARLSHPHILPLHDSGTLDLGLGRAVLFYAMPYVAGRSLRDRLREELQLPIDEAIGIARQVADALDHAHRQGVVHRDIKPENILLADGQAVLADFGIARAVDVASGERLTESGLALGTPVYMSPEQGAGSARVDGRTDIYALGCVLYEMLAGQPPFSGPTAQAILARHAIDPVPSLRTVRPTVSHTIGQVVTRALAKIPADRFPTARAFADALAQVSIAPVGSGDVAPTIELATRRIGGRRRHWLLATAVAAILTFAIGYALRRSTSAVPSGPEVVAVLPFRTAGASPELAWLGEGLVDLLTIALGSEGGLRAAEPRAVLSAWRRLAGAHGEEMTADGARDLAQSVGAARVIDGGVVGTPSHLTLTAAFLTYPGRSGTAPRVSVQGTVDSLPVLVNRLAGQLLSLDAGTEVSRPAPLTTTSVPAIRAYLAGRAAFRKGLPYDAARYYREATVLDSTFALAALELVHASVWTGASEEDAERGKRLALATRGRLGASDQALLDVWTMPTPTIPDRLRRWQAAARAYPDQADVWYGLGDTYYHVGLKAGLDDPLQLAAKAFQRGWEVDSASGTDSLTPARSPIFAEPLAHMVEIAQVKGDTGSLRRLVALGLAVDSTSRGGWYLRWHRAIAQGDSARRAFWATPKMEADPFPFDLIYRFTASSGVGMQDYPRVADSMFRLWKAGNPAQAAFHHSVHELNGGRPRTAARLLLEAVGDPPGVSFGLPIRLALYWGADTSAAVDGARRLVPYAAPKAVRGEAAQDQLQSLCALATWRLALGDYRYGEAAIRRLRGAVVSGLTESDSIAVIQYTALCAALLEASRSQALRLPNARSALELADSAARTYDVGQSLAANLVVARIAEAQGNLPMALRAVRRRAEGYDLLPTWYLSTFLHEEGRLATLTGDTAGAIRAYQHYLALRPNPEPQVKPEVEQVREELARLVGEHP